ncbi:DUF4148 domain-containing protein [Paraburkholderia sp. UCT2]|uniref:DUF4148 domain-containing protein n=1 Tax=Paraburkholderia sp. UCT2 TaxID=2615208 RepID=UPI001654FA70|nr:DUF4148 domain-containing protein [Paraburkholderia sp. UCT2]MBC8731496.1 DUF4148 domain-containing protein [Paraburkholderia sp. UCT2]
MTDLNGTGTRTSRPCLVVVSLTRRLLFPALETGSFIMAKAFMPVLTVVSVIALPTATSAQGNGPLTRELVHEEVIRLQLAGSDHPNGDAHYPANIHAALASVAAQQQAFSEHGGVKLGSAVSGVPAMAQLASYRSIYNEC